MSPPEDSTPPPSPRRGRPPGSVSLDEDKAWKIVSLIRAGAFDYVAAEAVGISARTFRDWISRGEETHGSRGSTPKLRRFAREVREARAMARVSAETRVFNQDPKYWLSKVARSELDRDGWTDLDPEAVRGPSLEDRVRDWELRGRQGGDLIPALQASNRLEDRVKARELRRARVAEAVPEHFAADSHDG